MSTDGEKAILRLLIIGPLEGDTEVPIGATAWITAEDEDRIVVPLSTGYNQAPTMVEISPGRVVIALRVPGGRRGQYTFYLKPGELKEIEFGTPVHSSTPPNTSSPFDSLELPTDKIRPQTTPIDPNQIEQVRPPSRNGDPWGEIHTGGSGWGVAVLKTEDGGMVLDLRLARQANQDPVKYPYLPGCRKSTLCK